MSRPAHRLGPPHTFFCRQAPWHGMPFRPVRSNEADPEVPDPQALLQELRDIQDALRRVADQAGEVTREARQKERLYEHIRNTRSFE